MMKKHQQQPRGLDLTRETAAKFFGVALPTIDKWIRAGAPGRKIGRTWCINSAGLMRWLENRERCLARRSIADTTVSQARAMKLQAEAQIAQIKLALETGQAVRIADYERILGTRISAARARLLGMGSKLAPLLVTCRSEGEARALIDAALNEALRELEQEPAAAPAPDSVVLHA
jgi:excisionase family DNA binding protein